MRKDDTAREESHSCNSQGLSRRGFLSSIGLGTGALAFAGLPQSLSAATKSSAPELSANDLPSGSAPAPVRFDHFPDRLHAFVWRNWQLVPAARMAQVLKASEADILRVGESMCLGRQPRITRDQEERSKLTIIRRNWHLLPYEQLIQLLGWTAAEMEFALREDDFLYIKLGSLKPKCDPLVYSSPDKAASVRAEEIESFLKQEFPNGVTESNDPLFGFVRRLSAPLTGAGTKAPAGDLRFCYSYFALYGDPLLHPELDPYPEGYLARLAQAGVNGVWLQAVLQKLAPFPWEPDRSKGHKTRLRNLRKLVDRARRHGIKVFLYLNEPRTMPARFFEKHPNLKGLTAGDLSTLCTSVPEVQSYLKESIASICRSVPDLGGFFTITASENLTNCWSHGGGSKCPRCSARSAPEVISEVNRLFAEGIRDARCSAKLIAWDWGWNEDWAPEAIAGLAPDTCHMSVSEWHLPIERGGIKSTVGEYSISAIGPGPRAKRHWGIAQKRGLKTIAKVQAGNTWELSTVPYIPALQNVARHAENLNKAGVRGLMLSWTLGGYPSPNLEVVSEVMACGSAEEAMRRVAVKRFGPKLGEAAIKAWVQVSEAFSKFPYNGNLLYTGPQQMGPANLLFSEATGYKATMTGLPYDDLESWRAIYPVEIFIRQFEEMATGFQKALADLREAAKQHHSDAGSAWLEEYAAECRVIEAAAIHFQSTANQARFITTRNQLKDALAQSDSNTETLKATLEKLLLDEIQLARRMFQLQSRDSRFGFEASNQYFFVPVDLAEKVVNCKYLLTHWLPGVGQPQKPGV